ncbi:RND transporter [Sporosarcina ureae]|uniref:RND transporter n=1 Tax=Sporosarcina ureae TaxID=1571 RepID=UPI0009DC7EF8|nr:RND transporter [Sporosarcina ureae]ARF18660.1 RND transporter [Sporosarcina ureae]
MKNKTNLKTINWSIFILVVLTAVITAILTLYDLYNTPSFGEAAQSRAEFRWGSLHIIILIIILVISVPLAIGWKRLFPFNIPIAIILVGFCYELFFLTFTTGWVGFLGTFGLLFAFLIGMILIISYLISFLIQRFRTTN